MRTPVQLTLFLWPLLGSLAMAQTPQQTVTYSTNDTSNFSGWTNCYTCYCSPQQRTPTQGESLNMSFTDTVGMSYVSIQVEVGWAVNCVGSSSAFGIYLNGTLLGPGSPGTTSCSCYYPNAGATVSQTFTLQPGNSLYVPNGSNQLRFTHTGTNYQFGLMNTTSNWCVRLTITGLNNAPAPPQNVTQTADSGSSPLPVGTVSNATIFFRGTVNDSDPGNTLGLQAEVLPSATAFGPNPTGTLVQTAAANFVDPGEVAEAMLDFSTTTLPSGNYHWRVRTVDSVGGRSPWVEFDSAPVHFSTDFVAPTTPGSPRTPNGVQLVFSTPSVNVPFAWGPGVDTGGPGNLQYRLEVSTDPGFTTHVYNQVVPGLTADVPMNASLDPYHWRVSSVDGAGNQSTPSPTSVFQLSWMVSVEKEDRFANCGASTAASSLLGMGFAATAVMLMALARGRRAA